MGFTMHPLQTAILLTATIPTLVGLAYYSGFEQPAGIVGAIVDAFVAYAVGAVIVTIILSTISVVQPTVMPLSEISGKIILQTIAASFGAILAASQMGGEREQQNDSEQALKHAHNSLPCYLRELFVMYAGAIFLVLNIAPTEEVIAVALKMSAWHALALVVVSLLIMHAFVFKVKFYGQESMPEEQSAISVFLRFTMTGYAIALVVSLFCLWVFGRTEGTAFDETMMATVVLAMPGAVGAAAARLIL